MTLFQGDLIGGIASDAFGRRRTLLVVCVIHMIFAYSAIFVRKYWLFILVRLFIGGTAHAAWSTLVSKLH
jgi:MFS family permease